MKMFENIIVLVLVAFLISACDKNDVQRSRSVEETAVYSALINEELEVPFTYLMGDPILIVSSTHYETVEDDRLYDELHSLDKDTLEDFKGVNQVSQTLDMPLSVNKPYEYIDFPSDENGWKEFQQKYPNAISITTLSKIGLNKDLDQALVYMSYFCGNECGTANIYFLARKGDTWKVEGSLNVWMS